MMSIERFRVRFEQEDGRGEIVNEKGVELTAREAVDLLNGLLEENERLQKNVENLQELVSEFGATLLMNGFEIEMNGENLSELIDDEY